MVDDEGIGAREGFRVRPCAPKDMAGILEILRESPEAASWSEAVVQEALSCDEKLFLVAESTGELLGFAMGRMVTDEGEVLNFAVKKEYRRRGVGRVLIEELLEELRQRGTVKVFLEVRESNTGAIAFYREMAFEQVGRRPGYYQQPDEAAVVMQAEVRRKVLAR